MADWAVKHDLRQVALGHTADDQAETFLMRLAREAGVDGLAAMNDERVQGRIVFCRPTLRITREELRQELRARDLTWIDDPTNEDTAFERVKARQVLAALGPLGISAPTLSTVAHHLAEVRDALYWQVFLASRNILAFHDGDVLIDHKGFTGLHPEIARRLLQEVLRWVSGAGYAPRARATELLINSIRDGVDMTLRGCLITVDDYQLRITRELKAVEELRVPAGEIWDGRWRLTCPTMPDHAQTAALGHAGVQQCPDWQKTDIPAASLAASPAIWQDGTLIAAPLAGMEHGWTAELVHGEEDYFAAILSH